jgi:hypothetical protein
MPSEDRGDLLVLAPHPLAFLPDQTPVATRQDSSSRREIYHYRLAGLQQ